MKLNKNDIEIFHRNNMEDIKNCFNKSNINRTDKDGRSLLIYSIIFKKLNVFEFCKDKGADVNLQDKSGWSALHFACQDNNYDFVVALIQYGANPNLQDIYGNTPLWKAVYSSQGKGEVIKILLSKNADKNLPNNYGISPIDLANTIANYDIKQFFD